MLHTYGDFMCVRVLNAPAWKRLDCRLQLHLNLATSFTCRVFVYREGLVRFCTTPYAKPSQDNLTTMTAHLTNYAVNKRNGGFVAPSTTLPVAAASNTGLAAQAAPVHGISGPSSGTLTIDQGGEINRAAGSQGGSGGGSGSNSTRSGIMGGDEAEQMTHKWSLKQLRSYLEGHGHSWDVLWASIEQLVAKSLISVAPLLRDTYRLAFPSCGADGRGVAAAVTGSRSRCFEVLGFDVLLDESLKAW